MSAIPDKTKLSLELPSNSKNTSPGTLPELSQYNGIVTPLNTANASQAQVSAITPCRLTQDDIQKLGIATPDLENFLYGSVALTPTTSSVIDSNMISSDKEDHCKGILMDIEANIKNRVKVDKDTSSEMLIAATKGDPSSTVSHISGIPIATVAAVNALSVKPTTLSSLVTGSGPSTSHNLNASLLRAAQTSFKLPPDVFGAHQLLASYPIAIVNPQPVAVIRGSQAPRVVNNAGPPPKVKPGMTPVSNFSSSLSSNISTSSRMCFEESRMQSEAVNLGSAAAGCSNDILGALNPDEQESLKRERKRLRNRIAATKCRQRKIEKISHFEEQIRDLKRTHTELIQQRTALKEKTSLLKENVLSHVKKGCNVIIAPLALADCD